jgi:hypothetical protein
MIFQRLKVGILHTDDYYFRMTFDSKALSQYWFRKSITRRSLFVTLFASAFLNTTIGRALGAATPISNLILGRPTSNSIALSILAKEKVRVYIEYGYAKSKYSKKSSIYLIEPNLPKVIELKNLRASSKVYYKLRYATASTKNFLFTKQQSFSTAKDAAASFSFTVHGDTHPERVGKMFNSELYYVTLANVSQQDPDFHILMGDDFSIDPLISKGQANQLNVEKIYRTHRNWLGVIGSSVPIFLVNGNHEQAAAYLLDGTNSNPAVLAGNARLKYYPLPAPNEFYSGNSKEVPGVGLPRDYYAWTWGDALFVTLDPYWHSKNAVDNVAGISVADEIGGSTKGKKKKIAQDNSGSNPEGIQENGKSKNLWGIGIGDDQYAWFKKTLEESTAKFKFVFAHHVMGTGRGGIERSYDYEWGGNDPKGLTSFQKERPTWELPIHDLMVKNKVSIFFQGHDHIFVTQERDGIIYQSMPNPADDTFSFFNEAAYTSGIKAPNSGHVRVNVTPNLATVEYFLAARSTDSGRDNLQVAHTYSVNPSN